MSEYSDFRQELMTIIQQRYQIFVALAALYGICFALVAKPSEISGTGLMEFFPLLLLTITLPLLIMNYYLSKHHYRIDTYLRILEHEDPDKYRWQRTYSSFR